MKIEKFSSNTMINNKTKKIETNSDFTKNLDLANKNHQKEMIDEHIKKIESIGNKIKLVKNYKDIIPYKESIGAYLKAIQKYVYSINKVTSLWENQYFTTVEVINEKLEELTNNILKEQSESIEISSSIDTIQGLLLDIYR